jgi:hypothetical protein
MTAIGSSSIRFASTLGQLQVPVRSFDWPELEAVLPDKGLPHAVVEITCAHPVFSGATSVAASAVRAVHMHDAKHWCAWVDGASTLYAPGLAQAGVDLARLLVVRPPAKHLPRVVVKVASSGAFDLVVVDLPKGLGRGEDRIVRKLALAAEQHGATIVLLAPPHVDPWPVALRLEVMRTKQGLDVRVTKDRFGRATPGLAKTHVPIHRAKARA